MSMPFYMYCHPWDLEAEGIEGALGWLAGEIGVDGISVAAATGDLMQLRTCPSVIGRVFQCPAAMHFQPDARHYSGSRLRLPAAAWMKSRNALERIVLAAEKQRLAVRVSIGPLRGATLVERAPHARHVNVFGDCLNESLCPANPDVREGLAAMMRDLSENYPLAGIELVAPGSWFPTNLQPWTGNVLFSVTLVSLLSYCFCPSCRQLIRDAGLDVEALVRDIERAIERGLRLEYPPKEPMANVMGGNELFAAYQKLARQALPTLVRSLRQATHLRFTCGHGGARSGVSADVAAVARECDGVSVQVSASQSPECEQYLAQHVGLQKVDASLFFFPPDALDGPMLVAAAKRATEHGYASVGFRTYGVAPEPCLDWVRQAIRYAKRESGG